MAMIPDLENYFRNFLPPRTELLRRLEEEAEKERIPIVGPVVGELLFILARTHGRPPDFGTGHGHRVFRHLPGPGSGPRVWPGGYLGSGPGHGPARPG